MESWASSPFSITAWLFDLVEAGLVQAPALTDGSVQYEITEAGRAEIAA